MLGETNIRKHLPETITFTPSILDKRSYNIAVSLLEIR